MKRNHLLISTAALCLLLASVALAQDGSPGGHGSGMSRRPGGGGMERWKSNRAEVMKALDLTDAQKTKLADIRDRQMRKGIQASADLKIAGLDLRKLITADKPDQRAIDAQVDRISTMRASLQKSRIAAMLEMRSVLTDEQRKKLKELRGAGGMGMGHGMGRGMGMGMGMSDEDEPGSVWGGSGTLDAPDAR